MTISGILVSQIGFNERIIRWILINYPTKQQVLEVHLSVIREFGGLSEAVLNEGNIDYTLDHIKHRYNRGTLKECLIRKAAFLLYNIVTSHPFVDGNKRTGLVSCVDFLKLNGFKLDCDYGVALSFLLKLAMGSGDITIAQNFVRNHIIEV